MIFRPRPYQNVIVQHLFHNPRSAIWAGMGMGKTSSCLMWYTGLRLYNTVPALIVAPLRVARDVWPQEIKKWDNFKHLKCAPIIGTPATRINALQTKADIYTINYENLQWLYKIVGNKWPWKVLIIDESTKIKSFRLRGGGKQSRVLGKIAWTKVQYVIELTGTPSPNSLLDLWGQVWFLDHGKRLERTFTVFRNKYFRLKHPNSFSYEPLAGAEIMVKDKIKDVCISLKSEDWFDLKTPIHYKIPVYLSASLKSKYDKLQRDMYVKLTEKHSVTAEFAASLTIKSLQFVNGAVYKDDRKTWTELHILKIEALQSIISEMQGENILVSYHFKSDLARLEKYCPQGVRFDQNPTTLISWNKGKIPLLFLHPASAGHGLNMQDGGRTIVFFSHWWNLEHREQVIERIGSTRQLQAGYNRSVYIYDIYAPNTIDDQVLDRHVTKKSIQDILLNSTRKVNLNVR